MAAKLFQIITTSPLCFTVSVLCWYAMLGFHQYLLCALWPNMSTLV